MLLDSILGLLEDFKMRKYIFLLVGVAVLFSCRKRLDSFLFNGDNTITSYELDDFNGPVSLDVGEEYFVPPTNLVQISVPFTSEDGEDLSIAAVYSGEYFDINTDTVILYCHGNRDHMDFYWPRQKLYSHLGGELGRYGVLTFDYPGFGLSTGKATEQNMYDATDAMLKWLKDQGLTDDRLIMFGFSLGSAPVCEVAANDGFEMTPNKIILEAPFASAEKMIQDAALISMPGSFFVNVKIDNAEEIKDINVPFLWIHGEEDDFLAIDKHGELVYDNYNGVSKTAVRVPGGGHENTPAMLGYTNYLEAISTFIAQ